MKNSPKRKSPRLKEYDYSAPGTYFVTLCTYNKKHILGTIVNGEMNYNHLGKIAEKEIKNIQSHYNNVLVDKYVIMPNHIHMLVSITEYIPAGGINPSPTITCDIPNIVGRFKAAVTRNVGDAFMHPAKSIWQRSFHDHIIRNKNDYEKIWEYIDTNVVRWELDCFYTK